MTNGMARLQVLLEMRDKLQGPLRRVNERIDRINGKVGQYARRNEQMFDRLGRKSDRTSRKLGGISGVFNRMRTAGGRAIGGISRGFEGLINTTRRWSSGLMSALGRVIPGMGQFSGMLGAAGGGLMAGGMLALGVGGASAAQAAGFNNNFLQLRLLNLDKEQTQLDQLRSEILSVSKARGLDSNQLARGVYDVQSGTGIYGSEALDIAGQVGTFSQVVGADINLAIGSTIKTMRAFKLDVDDTDRILENMFKTVQVGITDFNELTRVQTEYMGVAAATGQSLESANKIFAAFTATSKDANIAANMTKTAFQGLTDKKVVEGLGGIGVEMFDAQGEIKQVDEILEDLIPKIQSLSTEQFSQFKNALGGPEGVRELMFQVRSQGDELLKVFDTFDSSAFSLDKALGIAEEDTMIQFQRTVAGLKTTMVEMGTVLLPKVNDMLKGVTEFFRDPPWWLTGDKADNPWWLNGDMSRAPGSARGASNFLDGLFPREDAPWKDPFNEQQKIQEARTNFLQSDTFKQGISAIMGVSFSDLQQMVRTDPAEFLRMQAQAISTLEERLGHKIDRADPDSMMSAMRLIQKDALQGVMAYLPPSVQMMMKAQQKHTSSTASPEGGDGTPSTPTTTTLTQSQQRVVAGGDKVKNITVNIGTMMRVDRQEIHNENGELDLSQMEESVRQALVRAVRNFEQA